MKSDGRLLSAFDALGKLDLYACSDSSLKSDELDQSESRIQLVGSLNSTSETRRSQEQLDKLMADSFSSLLSALEISERTESEALMERICHSNGLRVALHELLNNDCLLDWIRRKSVYEQFLLLFCALLHNPCNYFQNFPSNFAPMEHGNTRHLSLLISRLGSLSRQAQLFITFQGSANKSQPSRDPQTDVDAVSNDLSTAMMGESVPNFPTPHGPPMFQLLPLLQLSLPPKVSAHAYQESMAAVAALKRAAAMARCAAAPFRDATGQASQAGVGDDVDDGGVPANFSIWRNLAPEAAGKRGRSAAMVDGHWRSGGSAGREEREAVLGKRGGGGGEGWRAATPLGWSSGQGSELRKRKIADWDKIAEQAIEALDRRAARGGWEGSIMPEMAGLGEVAASSSQAGHGSGAGSGGYLEWGGTHVSSAVALKDSYPFMSGPVPQMLMASDTENKLEDLDWLKQRTPISHADENLEAGGLEFCHHIQDAYRQVDTIPPASDQLGRLVAEQWVRLQVREVAKRSGTLFSSSAAPSTTPGTEAGDRRDIPHQHIVADDLSMVEVLQATEATTNLQNSLEVNPVLVGQSKADGCGCVHAKAEVAAGEVVRYQEVLGPLRFAAVDLTEREYKHQLARKMSEQVPFGRMARLAAELASLESSLPVHWSSSVFVRADQSRPHLLKALIVGPENTPYANGLFEFDILLPVNYPDKPPQVQLVTTGGGRVRFNPNLYHNGTVCLSLLGTWQGPGWIPRESSILQVLVSIQSMIFVADPFYNEPGMDRGSFDEESNQYDQKVRQNTLRWAILEQLRKPPPIFARVAAAHFWLKRDAILLQVEEWERLNSGLPPKRTLVRRPREFSEDYTKSCAEDVRAELAKLLPWSDQPL